MPEREESPKPVRSERMEAELFRPESRRVSEPLRGTGRAAAVAMGGSLCAVGVVAWIAELFFGGFYSASSWGAAATLLILPLAIGVPMLRSGLQGRDLFQERIWESDREHRELREDDGPAL